MISAFLFWIIKDCLFLLGYISGRQSFLKPLTPAEERDALLRMREGDEDARQMLIEHNMRLIVHVARKYKVPGCTSVSYTHLDVYKRQVQLRRRRRYDGRLY